jgi:hypothetical protein
VCRFDCSFFRSFFSRSVSPSFRSFLCLFPFYVSVSQKPVVLLHHEIFQSNSYSENSFLMYSQVELFLLLLRLPKSECEFELRQRKEKALCVLMSHSTHHTGRTCSLSLMLQKISCLKVYLHIHPNAIDMLIYIDVCSSTLLHHPS